ncbi:hypothetical protein CUZ56_01378 [Saezia sanguinis]|uniref:DUF3275 domain-containing protein n=1 Tax=Saezia sanguinis TaxID=1965230 RepID=A0A433SFB0_9BURK|nr:DUF3275 family protein [Saezia sanguinis]RUS67433.1 hypothetical protein CUZ56_01378 [Saezia sanguinis]
MQKFTGTLLVEKINGRYGPFNAAKLITSIGNFTVERKGFKELEMFDAGRFNGDFVVSEIFMGYYITNGKSINEIRARIESMTITSALEPLDPAEESQIAVEEVDPLFEETKEKQAVQSDIEPFTVSTPPKRRTKEPAQTEPSEVVNDTELFGEWPLPDAYKQDMSHDRATLRKQVERLNILGFALNPQDQIWYRKQA